MAADLVSIVIAGDSHVIGLKENRLTLELGGGRTQLVHMKPVRVAAAWGAMDMIVTFPDGRAGLNPKVESAFEEWPGVNADGRTPEGGTAAQHAVLSFGLGLAHYDPAMDFGDRAHERFLFRSDVDFLLPEYPDITADPSLTLLPVALVRDMYEAVLTPMKQALALISLFHQGRTWVMAAPPPPRDTAILQTLFSERAGGLGIDPTTVRAPRAEVLLKLWLLLRQSVMEICAASGRGFIDCADFAAGPDGFLKPKYVGDGIHGNAAYMGAMTVKVLSTLAAAESQLRTPA